MVIQRDGKIVWVPAEEMELLDDNADIDAFRVAAGDP